MNTIRFVDQTVTLMHGQQTLSRGKSVLAVKLANDFVKRHPDARIEWLTTKGWRKTKPKASDILGFRGTAK